MVNMGSTLLPDRGTVTAGLVTSLLLTLSIALLEPALVGVKIALTLHLVHAARVGVSEEQGIAPPGATVN